jgi:curved DNA-binding protein CbpA
MAGSERAPETTLYDLLGVAPTATADEIGAAYRASVRLHHPDVSLAPDAEATMVKLNEAFAVLRDPQRRAVYDLTLRPPAVDVEPFAAAGFPVEAAFARRPSRSRFSFAEDWARGTVPGFARAEHRRQSAARDLRTYWRNETNARPLGFAEKLGVMLVLPVFLAIVFLLGRLLH